MRKLMLLALFAVAGCATLANQTVGHVGCQESEIATANEQHSGPFGSTTTWDATCHGKTYMCAKHQTGGGNNPSYDVACSEKTAAPAPEAAAPAPAAQ